MYCKNNNKINVVKQYVQLLEIHFTNTLIHRTFIWIKFFVGSIVFIGSVLEVCAFIGVAVANTVLGKDLNR